MRRIAVPGRAAWPGEEGPRYDPSVAEHSSQLADKHANILKLAVPIRAQSSQGASARPIMDPTGLKQLEHAYVKEARATHPFLGAMGYRKRCHHV